MSGFLTAWASSNSTVVQRTAANIGRSRTRVWYEVITSGVREAECRDLLKSFFAQQRAKPKADGAT
ncbi:MAG: hypothetical protein HYZ36_01760 [Pedosphaera parvula]|nr:hypothetical protein [Pedosphaera parvula]